MTDPVTAPDLVEVVAGALEDHQFSMFTADGYCVCTCDAVVVGEGEGWEEFTAHQARAVLDALADAGNVEWGVRWGDGTHVWTRKSLPSSRNQIEAGGGVLVSRLTFPWTVSE